MGDVIHRKNIQDVKSRVVLWFPETFSMQYTNGVKILLVKYSSVHMFVSFWTHGVLRSNTLQVAK